MEISVIIPTRDRAERLLGALDHLAAQDTRGRFTYEVVVVDNGSQDHTRQAIEGVRGTFPVPLRYIYEPRAGRPWALNAGLRQACGRIFAIIDDDVLAPPTWLVAFWGCFQEEGADGVAGRVLPQWVVPRPAWLTGEAVRKLGLGCVDHGTRRISSAEQLDRRWVGGNMAVRREVVERIGGFDVRLIRGQDEEYYRRCLAHHLKVVYEPDAMTRHQIGAERMTPSYFRMWHHRAGYYRAYLMPWTGKDLLTVMPVWRYLQMFQWAAAWMTNAVTGRPWWDRFYCELRFREDVSAWLHRLQLWPRWWLTVLTGQSHLPAAHAQDDAQTLAPPQRAPGAAGEVVGQPRPFVSVIVPVFNGAATIESCVQSLLAQDYPRERHEIIVVDNNSSDETAAIVTRYPVRLVHERHKQSSYAARNRGVQEAQGEWLAFTDADCIVDSGWLSRLMVGHEDPSVGGLAGRVVPAQPVSLLEQFAVSRGQVSQDVSMANSFLPVAITANVAYRRQVWEGLGGFDETMISSGDMNFAWRLQLLHCKTIRFNRAAMVFHQHRASFRAFWKQHRIYGFGTAMLYDQFPDYAKPLRWEAANWLRRSAWFTARGLARLARWPVRRQEGRLYLAHHFLEVLCTTSRFFGMVQYRWIFRGRRPAPIAPTRTMRPLSSGMEMCVSDGQGPTVSVIIPTYNRAQVLGATIESVLAQTYQDLEVIVVDDGSTDDTHAVVERYVARSGAHVRYIRQANQGVSAARNTGCRAARGRYLALLDSDDLWKPQKLARQLPLLERDPRIGLVSSMAEIVDATNTRVLGIKPRQRPATTLREMVATGSAPPSSFVFRREALQEVGGFDPQIHGLEDLDFCFRVARRWALVYLEEPLIRYRQHGAGLSSDVVGVCRAYIRTYEKLLALPNADIPRWTVRQLTAKYHYRLGTSLMRQRQVRPALGELLRAIAVSPLVGLNFVNSHQPWWRRGVMVLKPYVAVCGVGLVCLLRPGTTVGSGLRVPGSGQSPSAQSPQPRAKGSVGMRSQGPSQSC